MKKKSSDILTTAEKKLKKQAKILVILVIVLLVNIVFNIGFLLNIYIPHINSQGKMIEINNDKPTVIDAVIKNNSEFTELTGVSVDYKGYNASYGFSEKGEICGFSAYKGFNYSQCDFEIKKWTEFKKILLKYQLKEYKPENHVDAEGRIENYNEEYEVKIRINNEWILLEVPKNIEEIVDELEKLRVLAETK